MKERAYAKINLALDVFAIREDNYHDLRSIMVPIDFYDELEIVKAKQDEFICNKAYIRYDENNSIFKMAQQLQLRYGIDEHYRIVLRKSIPTRAGLGGGTADAAAALRIFQKLHRLQLNEAEIKQICTSVGADVLFNYYNVPAVVEGIGDRLEMLPMAKTYHVLLVKPRKGVSTKEAYERLDMESCDHPDITALKEALLKGSDIRGLLGNSLEQPALLMNKDIVSIKQMLKEAGAENVLMSGSGSTVFCIDEDPDEIRAIFE